MELKNFKSGIYKQQFKYKSFSPNPININWEINDQSVNFLLSKATLLLGELNAFSQLITDVDYFIKMHVNKEATTSSRIEGTQTNIDEAIQKVESVNPERRDDWHEVQNYVFAMKEAINNLSSLPLSNRLLKNTHKILLQGVRGANKQPGEFRKSQNWIGGASLNDAIFIPPTHDEVPELMSDLEKFINDDNLIVPELIKVAIAHYQFETIHPFLDGNGRIGRLLITLYLVEKKILTKPTLYLSDFFEKNKMQYYENLTLVRRNNDLRQWLKFFLEGVRQTSESSINTFKEIIKLRHLCEEEIITSGRRTKHAKDLINYLYGNPIVESNDVAEVLNINISTALRLIEDFIKLGILKEVTGYKRNRIFKFEKYLDLFR